jgi:hypothetical protein
MNISSQREAAAVGGWLADYIVKAATLVGKLKRGRPTRPPPG